MTTPSNERKRTQRKRILKLLLDAKGAWVPLPEILALNVAQYNARLFELRHADGIIIENRRRRDTNGKVLSWYRIPAVTTDSFPNVAPGEAETGTANTPLSAVSDPRFVQSRKRDAEQEDENLPLFRRAG